MLHLAGICGGSFLRNAQLDKKVGQQLMTFVDLVGNGLAGRQQGDVTVAVHGNIAVFPQLFHGNADAGLADTQIIDHVDGSDRTEFLFQRQNRLQIILGRFVDLHGVLPFCKDLYFIRVAYREAKNKTLSAFVAEKQQIFSFQGLTNGNGYDILYKQSSQYRGVEQPGSSSGS